VKGGQSQRLVSQEPRRGLYGAEETTGERRRSRNTRRVLRLRNGV